ncbi:MAG: hypothetical protein L0K54_12785 [Tetragenococcus koreensis]|nr:hypothetical protein [Tetragenococcus koreensis]
MTGKTTVITKEILENFDFKNYKSPSDFIEKSWNYYKDSFDSNNSINGTIFENLVAYVLAYEGIDNIYEQAEVAFVPNAIFDILLYSSEQVFTLSLKTTLRERWKQADLEAYAVKNVLKSSKSYVITLSQREVEARRKQAKNKKDFYNGLDGFVIATNTEFDDLISELKKYKFTESDTISIIKANDRHSNLQTMNEKFDI